MSRNLYLLCIVLLGGMTSCNKEQNQWKQPVELDIKIDVNREASQTLVFNSGEVVIAAFEIEGDRIQAESISFSKEFAQGLRVPFDPLSLVSELDFDIPQGTYTAIAISFETYDDSSRPSLIVEGTYTNSSGTIIPLRFEFRSNESFSLVAEDDAGINTIVLNKDVPKKGSIRFDPIFWFATIAVHQLDNATLTTLNGVQTLFINEQVNASIYDVVADRIDQKTKMVLAPL